MGRGSTSTQPVFRAALDRCDELLAQALDRSAARVLFDDRRPARPDAYAQPALFGLQTRWPSCGIVGRAPGGGGRPQRGEYVAAVVAGVLSLDDGLR